MLLRCAKRGCLFVYCVRVRARRLTRGAVGRGTVKRQWERPRRTLWVWFLDTSKQAAGQVTNHMLNLGLALALGWWAAGRSDACVWYFVVTMLDSTVGLLLLAGAVAVADRVARRRQWRRLVSGEYGRPPRIAIWARQVALFVALVVLVKVSICPHPPTDMCW
jgi:hypothetical protein